LHLTDNQNNEKDYNYGAAYSGAQIRLDYSNPWIFNRKITNLSKQELLAGI
jgi:hypothetical protein